MRTALFALGLCLAAGLGGCTDFVLFEDEAPAYANGCTEAGCPQAAQFCVARGYQPGTDGYNRCIFSVEQNLRASR